MEFLKNYGYKQIEQDCFLLDIVPVENFPEICVCVDNKPDYITIFDGGSTLATLQMVYNFSSTEFVEKLTEICKTKKISKQNNVFFLECTAEEFETRLNDFVSALKQICEI